MGTSAVHATLATRRRSVQPTAIGLMPPSFLLNAQSDGPQKTGRTTIGIHPLRQMFVNSVSRASSR